MTSSTAQFGSQRGPQPLASDKPRSTLPVALSCHTGLMRSIAPAPADYDRASQVTEKR